MPIVQCPSCGKHGRFRSRDFRGAWWEPVRIVDCRYCSKEFGLPLLSGVDVDRLQIELAEDRERRKIADPRLFVSEFWVQVYVREKATDYGLKIVQPIRPVGPDFAIWHSGTLAWLEVEIRWDDFLKHGHHLDERFRQRPTIVALLSPDRPVATLRPLLPPELLFLKADDFLSWKEVEGSRFAAEVLELEGGQHTSYQRSVLPDHDLFVLRLQELARTIRENRVPASLVARDELVLLLQKRGDVRSEELRGWQLPLKSNLVDQGLIHESALQLRLDEMLNKLFPERSEKIDLKTHRTRTL